MATTVQIRIVGSDESKAALASVRQGLADVGDSADGTRGRLGSLLGSLASLGGTAVIGGIAGIGVGLVAAAGSGLSFNNTIEKVTAQLNAFTKDGAKSAEILEMIKTRAASTPFAFEEMASAAANLMPAAKASGAALEDLIKQAEILAASNPAQGLDGAAIALKEALSGDFVSIIERFNLPRQRLNELKDEGVPALEAVQIAMQELGLDSDLVSNLAETASGRWSTFKDTMQGVFATVTQPVFDMLSSSLGSINALLVENEPAIKAFADSLAIGVGGAIQTVMAYAGQLTAGWAQIQAQLNTEVIAGQLAGLGLVFDQLATVAGSAIAAIVAGVQGSGPAIEQAFAAYGAIVASVEQAFAAVAATVGAVLGQVQLFIDQHGAHIVTTFMTTWATVQSTVAALVAGLVAVINPILAQIQAFITAHGAEIRTFLATTWQQIAAAVTLAMQLINATVVPALKAIGAFISAHGAEIQALLTNAWTVVSTIITTALAAITGVIKATLQAINGDWSGAWTTIKDTCATIVAGLLTVIGATMDSMLRLFGTSMDEAISLVSGYASGFASAGRNLIEGMIDGVGSMGNALAQAARNMAQRALDSMMEALGIKSPSREAAEHVGVPFVQGIVQGMEHSFGLISKITGDLGKKLTKDMQKAADGAASAFRAVFIAGLQGQVDVNTTKLRNISAADDLISDNYTPVMERELAARDRLEAAQAEHVERRKALEAQGWKVIDDGNNRLLANDEARTAKLQQLSDDRAAKLAEVNGGDGTAEEKAKQRAAIEVEYTKKIGQAQADHAARDKDIRARNQAEAEAFAAKKLAAEVDIEQEIAAIQAEQAQIQKDRSAAIAVDERNADSARQAREALAQAEAEAAAMEARTGDAGQAARFYALRSQQIIQLAELQQELNQVALTGDTRQYNLLQQQYAQAQELQRSQLELFNATKGDKSPLGGLLRDLEALKSKFVDSKGNPIDTFESGQLQQLIDRIKAQGADRDVTALLSDAGPNLPSRPSSNSSTVNQFNLTIQTAAPSENIIADFQMMQAMIART